jgi:hypothetical protein
MSPELAGAIEKFRHTLTADLDPAVEDELREVFRDIEAEAEARDLLEAHDWSPRSRAGSSASGELPGCGPRTPSPPSSRGSTLAVTASGRER